MVTLLFDIVNVFITTWLMFGALFIGNRELVSGYCWDYLNTCKKRKSFKSNHQNIDDDATWSL